ncbi:MAG: hypothetical protein ACP5MG_04475 [Verrucomicrobiia bacterium]
MTGSCQTIFETLQIKTAKSEENECYFLWGNNVKSPVNDCLFGWEARNKMLVELSGETLLFARRLIAEIKEVSTGFEFVSSQEIANWWNTFIAHIQEFFVRINLLLEDGEVPINLKTQIETKIDKFSTVICYCETLLLYADVTATDKSIAFSRLLSEKIAPAVEKIYEDLSRLVAGCRRQI